MDNTLSYLEVVGHCPLCGNPIYGMKGVTTTVYPVVRRTCSCKTEGGSQRSADNGDQKKDIRDLMRTK